MTIYFILFIFILILLRIYFILPSKIKKKNSKKILNFLSVLGSGGHTTEMISLIEEIKKSNPTTICKFKFITSEDRSKISIKKKFPEEKEENFIFIPRSRSVHQSYFTSIFTTIYSFLITLFKVPKSDILLCNGPGVCIPVVFSFYFYKFFFNWKTKIFFVESIARVENLSLTGKILYFTGLTDSFLVQWNGLKEKFKNTEYRGRLL